ncbi:MAG: hypothetical protein WBN94_09895 [Methanothrix sp.]
MVRCDDYYKKYGKKGNFCGKHPDTAARIVTYMHLMPEIEEEAAKSEILKDSSKPIGCILTEGASRPLHSVKDAETQRKVIQQIVKKAEDKTTAGEKPQLTYKEVDEIVRGFVPRTPRTAKPPMDKFETAKTKLKGALDNVADTPDALDSAVTKIDELCSFLQEAKESLRQRKEVLSHESISEGPLISQSQSVPASAESGA